MRCFHCKDELFTVLERYREARGFDAIAYGVNADDEGDFRPGQQAARQHRVLAPLLEAGLNKAEIRELARQADLRVWDKPASACLSSRMEYGRAVTPEALSVIERGEDALRALGFRQFRVRHHGEIVRIEIAREELPRALTAEMAARVHRRVQRTGIQVRHSRPGGIPLRVDESTADCRRVAAADAPEKASDFRRDAACASPPTDDSRCGRGTFAVSSCRYAQSCCHEIIKPLAHVQVVSIDDCAARVPGSFADLSGLLGPVPSATASLPLLRTSCARSSGRCGRIIPSRPT